MAENPKPLIDEAEDGATIVTSFADRETAERYKHAVATYDPQNRMYSAYLNDGASASTLTTSTISSLGEGAQSNLSSVQSINAIIRKYINIDDIVGMVVQSIQNNINTDIRLSYRNFNGARNKTKTLEKAQAILNDFNSQVRVEQFIRVAIITAYIEGNFAAVLRNNTENWQIDWLPLDIIENSGYESNGNPVLLVGIDSEEKQTERPVKTDLI